MFKKYEDMKNDYTKCLVLNKLWIQYMGDLIQTYYIYIDIFNIYIYIYVYRNDENIIGNKILKEIKYSRQI